MSDRVAALESLVGDDEWSRHHTLERIRQRGLLDDQLAACRAALADSDARTRAAARMALAAAAADGSPSASAARRLLLDALAAGDEDLRVLAASALGESGSTAVADPLVAALGDPSANVVAAAADALGEIGAPEAVEPLAALADAPELWVRAAAIVALGRLRDTRSIPALARTADLPGAEIPLIEALREVNDPAVLPVLRILARSRPMEALLAAGAVLCAFPDRPVPAWVRQSAVEQEGELLGALEQDDDPAAARLAGIAASPAGLARLAELLGPPRRSEAALAGLLAAPAEERADALVARFPALDSEELVMLLSLLPPVQDHAHIAALAGLLSHPDADVIGAAAKALARSPTEWALPLLAAEVERAGGAAEVVRAMGGLGDTACAALVPLMTDPSPDIRTAAAEALAQCADPSVVRALEDALGSESLPATRRALLRALGRAGGPIGPLVLALDDPDAETRIAAIAALGEERLPAAVPYLRRHLDGPEAEALAALRALGQVGGAAAAEALVPSLASSDLDRRRTAVRSALEVADALPREIVERLTGDEDEWVRVGAVRIIARRGLPEREWLERLASSDPSPPVRAEARRSIEEG